MPLLTIGCSNWDDPLGAWETYTSLRNHHYLNSDIELLCVDDMPTPQEEVQRICGLSRTRYVHKSKNMGPAHAKNSVFEEAKGEYVLLLDCHVFLGRDTIRNIMDLLRNNRVRNNLISGPLMNEAGDWYATELEAKMRGSFYGIWATDPLMTSGVITEKVIWGMGSAMFLCRKESWDAVGGFPKHFKGFGGEEGIISELFRQKGGQHICHSNLPWIHRFLRYKPITYTCTMNDKMRNYLIGSYLAGYDTKQMTDYFRDKLPKDQFEVVVNTVLDIYPDLYTKNQSPKKLEIVD